MFNQRDLGRREMFGAIIADLEKNTYAIDLARPCVLQEPMLVSFSPTRIRQVPLCPSCLLVFLADRTWCLPSAGVPGEPSSII